MQSSRINSFASRFSPQNLRSSFRRSSSASSSSSTSSSSSSSSSHNRLSYSSQTSSSPVMTINSIMSRSSSIVDLEEERKTFGSELSILEPRPVVYWGGLEERMGSL